MEAYPGCFNVATSQARSPKRFAGLQLTIPPTPQHSGPSSAASEATSLYASTPLQGYTHIAYITPITPISPQSFSNLQLYPSQVVALCMPPGTPTTAYPHPQEIGACEQSFALPLQPETKALAFGPRAGQNHIAGLNIYNMSSEDFGDITQLSPVSCSGVWDTATGTHNDDAAQNIWSDDPSTAGPISGEYVHCQSSSEAASPTIAGMTTMQVSPNTSPTQAFQQGGQTMQPNAAPQPQRPALQHASQSLDDSHSTTWSESLEDWIARFETRSSSHSAPPGLLPTMSAFSDQHDSDAASTMQQRGPEICHDAGASDESSWLSQILPSPVCGESLWDAQRPTDTSYRPGIVLAGQFPVQVQRKPDPSQCSAPQIYQALAEPLPPTKEDFNPRDPFQLPQTSEPKFGKSDMYSPSWIRGLRKNREAWCGNCRPGHWLNMANSRYNYHRAYYHGINPGNGKPFEAPIDLRRPDPLTSTWEALCGECKQWIKIKKHEVPGNSWFRHAHKVSWFCVRPGQWTDQLPLVSSLREVDAKDAGVTQLPTSSIATTASAAGNETPGTCTTKPRSCCEFRASSGRSRLNVRAESRLYDEPACDGDGGVYGNAFCSDSSALYTNLLVHCFG